MAEEQQPSGLLISKAIRAQQQSSVDTDRTGIYKTLVKSSEWKKNSLKPAPESPPSDPAAGAAVVLQALKQSLLNTVERHWQDLLHNAVVLHQDNRKKPAVDPVVDGEQSARRESELQDAVAFHKAEAKDAKRQLRMLSATLKNQTEEIDRLQKKIATLEDEHALLRTEHQEMLNAQQTEFVSLCAAYDQFQAQSDQILSELDQENERLRTVTVLDNQALRSA